MEHVNPYVWYSFQSEEVAGLPRMEEREVSNLFRER